jgi:hypothetical protein
MVDVFAVVEAVFCCWELEVLIDKVGCEFEDFR